MILSGWGRYPRIACEVIEPRDCADVFEAVDRRGSLIARGNGRSYGDAALNHNRTILMGRLDRLISFDVETGILACEAGILLSDILSVFVPRGWFVRVTPGTKFVSVGGMIASDVHGKNHHGAGSFGRHLVWLDLMTADGRTLRCSREENAELFAATIGGMGLTGVILRAAFPLMPIETDLMAERTLKVANLDAAMDAIEAHSSSPYSVAWIDCLAAGKSLGRSLVFLADHVRQADLPVARNGASFVSARRISLNVPFSFPKFALSKRSVEAFNLLYYQRAKSGTRLAPLDQYFYPLDSLQNWNRLYGRDGFVQYQFVLPRASSRVGMNAILARIAEQGTGSFLAVLKLLGPQDGFLSFPMDGYTLAVDFPATVPTFNLLTELDAMVSDYGGRIYLAKDSRSGVDIMKRGYPLLPAFASIRDGVDPDRRFASLQSRRLGL